MASSTTRGRATGVEVTGIDLRRSIEAVLAGGQPDAVQVPSIGCNIKWLEGNQPAKVSAAA